MAILIHCNLTLAQETSGAGAVPERAGKHFIATQVYSLEEDRQLLGWFDGLRVVDVCDGMDMDKTQRRRAYDELGMPTDRSVEFSVGNRLIG